jgi:hypothetical protein
LVLFCNHRCAGSSIYRRLIAAELVSISEHIGHDRQIRLDRLFLVLLLVIAAVFAIRYASGAGRASMGSLRG